MVGCQGQAESNRNLGFIYSFLLVEEHRKLGELHGLRLRIMHHEVDRPITNKAQASKSPTRSLVISPSRLSDYLETLGFDTLHQKLKPSVRYPN